MSIEIEEFNKFNKKTLLSKTRMPEIARFTKLNLLLSSWRSTGGGTPLFRINESSESSMKWLVENSIIVKVMTSK